MVGQRCSAAVPMADQQVRPTYDRRILGDKPAGPEQKQTALTDNVNRKIIILFVAALVVFGGLVWVFSTREEKGEVRLTFTSLDSNRFSVAIITVFPLSFNANPNAIYG